MTAIATDEDGLPTQTSPRSIQRALVDDCGDEVVATAPDLTFMERWDEVLVACTTDGRLVELRDPADPSPRSLARHACGTPEASQGHVAVDVDDATGTARLLSLRTNGAELFGVDIARGRGVSG